MTTFAQIPIIGGVYNSIAILLLLDDVRATYSNMEFGPHYPVPNTDGYVKYIEVTNPGYYRVAANLQISGVTGSQAVFYIKQNSNVINQYFLDIVGNMIVSFETTTYCAPNDKITLNLTVSTNGAVIINPPNSPTYPSALFAYLLY